MMGKATDTRMQIGKNLANSLVIQVKNQLKIETQVHFFSHTKVHLRCNYLNCVDSQYIMFSNKT